MKAQKLFEKLERIEKFCQGTRLERMRLHPFKFFFSTFIVREVLNRFFSMVWSTKVITFFNQKMNIRLPAATDIYLLGVKSHDSEIRLAKFLLLNIKSTDCFIDIGAHYGYYSLLANELMEDKGEVHAFEASVNSFKVLKENLIDNERIHIHQRFVSNNENSIEFYEFPDKYSEYNSLDKDQFKTESWYNENIPRKIYCKAISLDKYVSHSNIRPDFIKVDVEGGEHLVVEGAIDVLTAYRPVVVMEYLNDSRSNDNHKIAIGLLNSLGYNAHRITQSGALESLKNIDRYLEEMSLDSDNIVFAME